MPSQTQYLPRKQEIIEVCRQAREDCGIHWAARACASLDIPERTLRRLCRQWRVFYTNRQFYRKNKQHILEVVRTCKTLEEAAAQLKIPRSTLYDLRKKWMGARASRYNRPQRFVGRDGTVSFVNRVN